jgi:hypothetical protein
MLADAAADDGGASNMSLDELERKISDLQAKDRIVKGHDQRAA